MLASSDIENILGSLTPRVEESVAALVDMTPSEWRKQSREKKAKQLVDFQNRGLLAATLASAAKAQTDLALRVEAWHLQVQAAKRPPSQ